MVGEVDRGLLFLSLELCAIDAMDQLILMLNQHNVIQSTVLDLNGREGRIVAPFTIDDEFVLVSPWSQEKRDLVVPKKSNEGEVGVGRG